ncbi:MAG: AAA family ATPase [Blastocatellia bacterium]
MRIAVSGTHCCGKSTLISEFLLAHSGFTHEPEPYAVLEEEYGEAFAAEPSPDDFYRQLEFNVDRLRRYLPAERVIYERSPVDFLAYILALNDLGREQNASRLVESSLGIVREGIRYLDLIVFLPITDVESIVLAESEDAELRNEVDRRLVRILSDDDFNLFTVGHPVIIEAIGSTAQRLQMLESAIGSHLAESKSG